MTRGRVFAALLVVAGWALLHPAPALAWTPEIAALARQHNDANVLALPARFISPEEALAIVDAFLAATFEGGRHQRRVEKIEHPENA